MELIQTQNTLVIEDTASVGYSNAYILQKIQTDIGNTENIGHVVGSSGGVFTLPSDGYYMVHKFQITTIQNNGYYISAGEVYGPGDDLLSEYSIYSLLTIEDYEEEGIAYDSMEHLNYYNIETYYINLLKTKFLKNMCGCSCDNQSNRITIDTLTMGLEVIKYLIEYSQYNEASRIVDMLSICTGVININCNCNA